MLARKSSIVVLLWLSGLPARMKHDQDRSAGKTILSVDVYRRGLEMSQGGNCMVILVRTVFGACAGATAVTGLWWFLVGFWIPPGIARALMDVPLWNVAVVGAIFGAIFGMGQALKDRRIARMNREVAEKLGCEFVEYVPSTEMRSWPAVSLFRNDSPSGHHRMTGTHNGRRIDVFDFKYTVTSTSAGEGSSSSTSTYSQTVYRFPEAAQGGPRFLLKPRHRLMGLLSSLIGATEVELEPGSETNADMTTAFGQFRKHYQITVPDGTESTGDLQQVFHPFVVGWLSLHPGWSIESKGGDVVAWRSDATVVGPERLRVLDELSELLSLMAASDMALERTEPARIEVHAHDRTRGLSGFMGLWSGVILGTAAGGMLGALVLSEVFALMPDNTSKFPVVVVLFFGSTIAFAVLGGFLGLRLGRRSEWGRRLAKRIDPRPTDESIEGRTTDA